VDPLTILAVAKGSYEAIKTGIKLGKEVQGMFKDISSLMDSVGKLTQIAADPPKPKLFGKESAEKLAMDAFMAKREVEKMFAEAKNLFISEQGLQAWDWVMAETARIKKEQKAAALVAQKEREEQIEEMKFFGLIAAILVFIMIMGTIGIMIIAR
jgi:hypothetical protein